MRVRAVPATCAVAAIGAGLFLGSVFATADQQAEEIVRPDMSQVVSSGDVDGLRLSVTRAAGGAESDLCFVVEGLTGSSSRVAQCGAAAEIEAGVGGVFTDRGEGVAVGVGYATKGETRVSLGSVSAEVDASGFWVVRSAPNSILRLYRGQEVVLEQDQAKLPPIPSAAP